MNYRWPHGRRFAFTICDDTDNGTLANLRPIYDALAGAGLRITKTVWSSPCAPGDRFTGESLRDPGYAQWVQDLSRQGFEIGWHGNRSGGSKREEVIEGLEIFRSLLGAWPSVYANHAHNVENLYWGEERFDSKLIKSLYALARSDSGRFKGSQIGNEYYWADVCHDRIEYVRDFTFEDIVTTDVDRFMPYFDPRRPLVRAWFSSCDTADAKAFVRRLTPDNLDKLADSGGACILYTHLASGFVRDGRVNADVLKVLADLKVRSGWYVPVKELLDHLVSLRGVHQLTMVERTALERRWAIEHFKAGMAALRGRITNRLSGRQRKNHNRI